MFPESRSDALTLIGPDSMKVGTWSPTAARPSCTDGSSSPVASTGPALTVTSASGVVAIPILPLDVLLPAPS